MKRRLWGIILVSLGTVALSGTTSDPAQRKAPTIVLELLMVVGGVVLIKAGQAACERHEAILNAAFRHLRQYGAVRSVGIAKEAGTSEFDVRESLRLEVLSGLLPPDTPIDPDPTRVSKEAFQ